MAYDMHSYNSLNEGDPKKTYQNLRDMDKYDYGANVSNTSTTRHRHSRALRQRLNGGRPSRSKAASSSHQNQGEAQRQDPKGKGKGKKGGKSSKSSEGSQPTWQRVNWNHRSWNNPAMSMHTYDATFRDAQWNNPAMRGDLRHWDNYYSRGEEEEDYEEDTGR